MGAVYLLDCTLRDGGYVNDWQFGEDAIKGTAQKIAKTGIEFFEIGFLKEEDFSKDRAIFPTVESVKPFLGEKSSKMKYVGMIDCGNPVPLEKICIRDGTSLDGIRVIFKKDKRDFAYNYCDALQQKGYDVFVQFVATDLYSDVEFVETIQRFNALKPFAMSIVDTFGTIKRKAFLRMVYLADNNMASGIVLGYHAHNNLQQAFGNAQTLVELNLKRDVCIDACVFGMGRGAGNLNLELFADYMNENYDTHYKIEPMLEIMDDYLQESYNKRFWGYCLPYYLSASNGCHPNYAIYYAEKQSLREKNFNELLKSIPQEKKHTYNVKDAEQFYREYMSLLYNDENDKNALANEFNGKKILVLAPGMTLKQQKSHIADCIKTQNPLIVALNCAPKDFNVDYIFSSNIRRYARLANASAKKIITSNIQDAPFDYKLNFSSYCLDDADIIDNSGLMFLRFLETLNPACVFIAGMDGYGDDANYFDETLDFEFEKREKRNELIQNALRSIATHLQLKFITSTRYVLE